MRARRGWLFGIIAIVLLLAIAAAVFFIWRPDLNKPDQIVAPKPEAPPDLAKLRPVFVAAKEALDTGNPAEAVKRFGSFTFGGRAIEQYRLYLLAYAHEQAGEAAPARATLAGLWSRSPRMVGWDQIGARLAGKYADGGDFPHAWEIAEDVATRSDVPAVAAAARWQVIQSAFAAGDVSLVLHHARQIAIRSPRSKQAADAIAIVRTITGKAPTEAIDLTDAERLERAVALMRDGDPQSALDELTPLDGIRDDLRLPVQLNRGLALNQVRRYEDSNRVLEPLTSGPFKVAIPAIYTASKNYRVLANSINPIVIKSITVRQKVGTVKVKPKGKKKAVVRPKYANVKKNVQLVDLAKKAKKEEYERLSIERLKDLLLLPLADEVRIEVLNTLISFAESKNQDPYARDLVTQLAKVDPGQEAALQHFWDKGWAAYSRGDLKSSVDLFTFIRDTYRTASVRRAAQYWYARSVERMGDKAAASAIYNELASAPYLDLYAMHAARRGGARRAATTSPFRDERPDWPQIAEKDMPAELRLAYELTAVTDFRDARLEIQKNLNRSNEPFADALMGDLYNSSGDTLLMMRALKRAFPKLATVEQDDVPRYFLRMYYPTRYHDEIVRNAKKNDLDPFIIMGLVHQESYYNPRARSSVGATGLMQLMPPTAREIARRLHTSSNLEDPTTNVKLGTYYFRMLVNMFGGDTNLAIASYNAGMGNVARWRRAAPNKPMDEFLESIPFAETRTYVKRVNMLGASYRRFAQ
jgi:soluble lytic murein transglycosylase-like protein